MIDIQATRLLELRHELAVIQSRLNVDETEALLFFARKLDFGSAKHGGLNLATDRRDFAGKELREELIDAAFYLVFAAIKSTRGAPEIADERLR